MVNGERILFHTQNYRKGELIYVTEVCFVTMELEMSTIYFFLGSHIDMESLSHFTRGIKR